MRRLKIGDKFIKSFGTSITKFKIYDVNEAGYYCYVGCFLGIWGIGSKFYFPHWYLEQSSSFKLLK